MNEREFWIFLERLWQKGRAQQLMCTTDHVDSRAYAYLQGHALLPKEYDGLSGDDIINMGKLLFEKQVNPKTKEAIMIILGHQSSETALTILAKYNLAPDKGLEFFAGMALDECAMWNE